MCVNASQRGPSGEDGLRAGHMMAAVGAASASQGCWRWLDAFFRRINLGKSHRKAKRLPYDTAHFPTIF